MQQTQFPGSVGSRPRNGRGDADCLLHEGGGRAEELRRFSFFGRGSQSYAIHSCFCSGGNKVKDSKVRPKAEESFHQLSAIIELTTFSRASAFSKNMSPASSLHTTSEGASS